jgi:biotin carboxylase
MKKKIAILGASEPHLPLYLKAKEMGLEIYCFAWSEGAFCKDYADHYYDISILEKEKITEICQLEKIDGVVSNALDYAVPTVSYVSEKLNLNGISYQSSLKATNKHLMRDAVKEANACLQPNYHIYDKDIKINRFPVIVKPSDSSSSNGVTKVNKEEDLLFAVERALLASKNKEILIEEFIDGREISVESISYHGKHYILTITDKETTGEPYFVETAHHQPSDLIDSIQDVVKRNVDLILTSLDIKNGASHAEFKIDEKGDVYFIELGARGGGDFISYNLVELSTGYDYVKGMIEVALNEFKIPRISESKFSGVYFLGKDTEYIQRFIEKNKNLSWVRLFHIDEAPLKELKKSQDRSGYIVYQSNNRILIN